MISKKVWKNASIIAIMNTYIYKLYFFLGMGMVSVMLISDESQREDKLVSESESDSEDSAEIPLNSDKQV